MREIWKPTQGFPGYEVSNHGRVRSFKKRLPRQQTWTITDKPQRFLAPCMSSGYRTVFLCHKGVRASFRISYLVLKAFVGPRPEGMEVCHKDCNKENDRIDNLRYDTPSGNATDGFGKETKRRVFTKQEALQVRLLAAQGYSDEDLAKRFNVSVNSVCLCRLGHFYIYAGGPLTNRTNKLTDVQVREIRQMAHEGSSTYAATGKIYGVSESTVSLIARGKRREGAGGPISPRRYRRPTR